MLTLNYTNILFPPFVSLFTNENNKSCLYYFGGIDNNGKRLYELFNDENIPEHIKKLNSDGSVIYEFTHKILHIKCKLISLNTNIPDKIIYI